MAEHKDDWKLCLEWLVKCQVLPDNHPSTLPGAQVFDLAQSLRDGVLICHLLNRLCPGILPPKDFSQRPQMSQFLCKKNIGTFLQICSSKFGLKEADLFSIPDLFEIKDFGKVIDTLSKLSRTALAQKQNIPGFSMKQTARTKDEIYGDLQTLAEDQDVADEYYDSVYPDEDKDEEIYEDVMSIQRKHSGERSIIEPKTKRDFCLRELVETEKNYVEALKMIIKFFIQPLSAVLEPKDIKTIFKGIEDLHERHEKFLSEIHKAVLGHTVGSVQVSIADCFIQFKESFLIYGDFCSHLPVAQEHVDNICNNPAYRDQVMECQRRANEGKFRLRDLLSVPMQRVLKYHLLIHELIKHTDANHPDKKSLPVALSEMQDLSSYINEVKRDNEMNQNVKKIEESITDLQMPESTSLIDYGRLQRDGELRVKSHDDNKFKSRYVFLFDKVILMCKTLTHGSESGYSYKNALILSQYRVDEGKKSRDVNSFSLVENGEKNVYTFSAGTADLKQKWIDSVTMAMDNVNPKGSKGNKHDFIMSSFTSASICDVCRKLLRGIFFQGYKCTKLDCNMKVHKECIIRAQAIDSVPAPEHLPAKPTTVFRSTSFTVPPASVPTRSTAIAKCKAKFGYTGKPPPENGRSIITFEVNDVIELLSCEDRDWWEGRINGYHGYFPSAYVEVTRSPLRNNSLNVCVLNGNSPAKAVVRNATFPRLAAAPNFATSDKPPIMRPACHSPIGGIKQSVPLPEIRLDVFKWYVGKMSRDDSQDHLKNMKLGTYLVRESTSGTRQGEYALSIRSVTGVRHIKINKSNEGRYYLAECRHFYTINELVEYYQQNSLKHSFPELDMTLQFPFKDTQRGGVIIGYCIAQYDYAANQSQMLSLRAGDHIAILNKGSGGWWKGDLGGRKGYFPCTYVVETSDD